MDFDFSVTNHHINEPTAPGLDKGHAWVVMLASCACFFLIGGSILSSGLIHAAMLERFHDTEANTAWVGALHLSLLSSAAPFGSIISDRFSCRVALLVSGLLMTSGYLATAFAPSLWWCVFTCGVVAGTGGGIGYATAMVVVGYNFKEKRNVATAISVSGSGVGLLVLSPIIQAVREYYGITGFFIVLAGLTVHIIVFAMLCRPSALELKLQRHRKEDEEKEKKENGRNRLPVHKVNRYINLCTDKAVAFLSISYFFYGICVFMVFFMLPNYCVHKGFTSIQGSFLLSVAGICSVLSRLLTGFAPASPNIDEIVLYSGSYGVLGIVTFLFPLFSDTYAGQLAYAVSFGLYYAVCYPIINTINVQFVGSKHFAAAVGIEFFYCGIAAAIGPIIAGMIVDATGKYETSFMIAAICISVGSMFGLLTYAVKPPTKIMTLVVPSPPLFEQLSLQQLPSSSTLNTVLNKDPVNHTGVKEACDSFVQSPIQSLEQQSAPLALNAVLDIDSGENYVDVFPDKDGFRNQTKEPDAIFVVGQYLRDVVNNSMTMQTIQTTDKHNVESSEGDHGNIVCTSQL